MQPRVEEGLPHPAGMTRRRDALGLVRASVSAGAMVAAVMVAVSALFFPPSLVDIDPSRGEAIFRGRCASCHSLDAQGPPRFGPSLGGIGEAAGRRVPGMGPEEYILTSIVRPGSFRAPGAVGEMPEDVGRGLTPGDLMDLTAYLASPDGRFRGRTIADLATRIRPAEETPAAPLSLTSVERGKDLFLRQLNCNVCHSLDSYPGNDLLAPSLLEAGRHGRSFLEAEILRPSERIAPGYETWLVSRNGLPQSGRRLPGPAGVIRLLRKEGTGEVREEAFKEEELDPLDDGRLAEKSGVSPMPDLGASLGREDLGALVDFLSTLR
jgi:mono/diheme cytochrome c family protein